MFFIYNSFRENTIELSVSARIVISAQTPIFFHLFTALKDTLGLGYSCFFFSSFNSYTSELKLVRLKVLESGVYTFSCSNRDATVHQTFEVHVISEWKHLMQVANIWLFHVPEKSIESMWYMCLCVFWFRSNQSYFWEFCWIKELDCLCKTLA